MKLSLQAAMLIVAAFVAGCGSPPPSTPVQIARRVENAAPPPTLSTPVPIVKAKANPNAGRSDPFVALYSGTGASQPNRVAKSTYPRIPTLPGFEGAPNGVKPASIWDSVKVTGIVQANGFSAIIEAEGNSFIAREGDAIDNNKIRVVAIGPGYVTLSSAEGVRNFSLGG